MLSEQHGMKLNISGERKQDISQEENTYSANMNIYTIGLFCSRTSSSYSTGYLLSLPNENSLNSIVLISGSMYTLVLTLLAERSMT